MSTKYWINSDGSGGPGLTPHTATGQNVATAHTANDTLLRVRIGMRSYATVVQSTDQSYPSWFAQTFFKYGLWLDKVAGAGVNPAPGSFGDGRFVFTDILFPNVWVQPPVPPSPPPWMLIFDQHDGVEESEAKRKGNGANLPSLKINWQLVDPQLIIDDPLGSTNWQVHFGLTFWVRSLWETP